MLELAVTEQFSPGSLGVNMGAAGVLGFISGYAAKKVMKLIAVLIGAQLAFLAYLERTGIVTIDWAALTGRVNQGLETGEQLGSSLFDQLVSISVLGGSFAAGAGLGFKRA